MIPNDLWERISEGLWFLCGMCIMQRLEALDGPLTFHVLEGRAVDLFPERFPYNHPIHRLDKSEKSGNMNP